MRFRPQTRRMRACARGATAIAMCAHAGGNKTRVRVGVRVRVGKKEIAPHARQRTEKTLSMSHAARQRAKRHDTIIRVFHHGLGTLLLTAAGQPARRRWWRPRILKTPTPYMPRCSTLAHAGFTAAPLTYTGTPRAQRPLLSWISSPLASAHSLVTGRANAAHAHTMVTHACLASTR